MECPECKNQMTISKILYPKDKIVYIWWCCKCNKFHEEIINK